MPIPAEATTVIDAKGTALCPGLIDSHVHPVFGDWTPRQSQLNWIDSFLHGGVTTMVSAGEVHLPGRPRDVVGLKALAITAQRSFSAFRPGGVKLHAGAPVLEKGMVEQDFIDLAQAGVTLLGEVGLGSVKAGYEAKEMVAWARKHGMQSTIHTGGPSIPGSGLIDKDTVLEADADVIGHINGGHTSLPEAHVCELCEVSKRAIELVHNGNERVAIAALKTATATRNLHRVILGTDSPAGSGVQPLGILRMMALAVGARRLAGGTGDRLRDRQYGADAQARLRHHRSRPRRRLRVHRSRPAYRRQGCAEVDRAGRSARHRHGGHRRRRALRPQPQYAAGGARAGSVALSRDGYAPRCGTSVMPPRRNAVRVASAEPSRSMARVALSITTLSKPSLKASSAE